MVRMAYFIYNGLPVPHFFTADGQSRYFSTALVICMGSNMIFIIRYSFGHFATDSTGQTSSND